MEICENNLKFTEAENKIRKMWLFWSVLFPSLVLGLLIIFLIFSAFFLSKYTAIMLVLLFSLVPVGFLYMNYHCAYKNPGTNLLLLGLIGIPLNLLTTFFEPKTIGLMKASPPFLLFLLAILSFELIVFYYSYQLRKINKSMKERKLISSPVYVNALSVFSTATTLEELNGQFAKLRNAEDSGSTIQSLAKAYDQQKIRFSSHV